MFERYSFYSLHLSLRQVINYVLSTAVYVFRVTVVVLDELFDKITRTVSVRSVLRKTGLNSSLWQRRVVGLGRVYLLIRCGRPTTRQTANGPEEPVKTSTKMDVSRRRTMELSKRTAVKDRRSENSFITAHNYAIYKRNVVDSWPLILGIVVGTECAGSLWKVL